ncbi:MAG: hypothetical protein EZS28_002231 [Streblomastix strix]|uniref:SH3 domain-containing protein n=1 Tax=Streblomastix strix TaxID=222440 RepID=A0A5J4X4T6_9EUKA|nr:MAG: hypothetical protein EZS28_002231 [Streblomastix strix]
MPHTGLRLLHTGLRLSHTGFTTAAHQFTNVTYWFITAAHWFTTVAHCLSKSSQYFEAIADYGGVEGDTNYIAVMKGDVVRLIKKDKEWLTVEKDGDIGKNIHNKFQLQNNP